MSGGIKMKSIIIYASTHHGNTYKLVEAISKKNNVEVVNAMEVQKKDLSEYDLIGFASGIDFGKFYNEIEEFAKNNLPDNKKVFFIYTCAMKREGFTQNIQSICESKNSEILGEYGCKGYNTYGPWKVIGGMNKSHPNADEIQEAIEFYESFTLNA